MKRGNWLSAFLLFAYAICFSFAYISLTTGTGALILFGCVQLTMILAALFKGEKPKILEWVGMCVALGGLIYLVFPGLTSPPLFSSALMAFAGISWGIYTLRGKGSSDPLGDTTGNFVRSAPMIIIAVLPFLSGMHLSGTGILLAVLSGAAASGIGYTVWYTVLKHHHNSFRCPAAFSSRSGCCRGRHISFRNGDGETFDCSCFNTLRYCPDNFGTQSRCQF